MKELFGGILMGIGIIIAGASGLCSLMVFVSGGIGNNFSMLPAVLVFGGPPIALGVGMFYGGRALIRQARSDDLDHPQ
jgi:hypothetical protein